jgi:hypothetical protein
MAPQRSKKICNQIDQIVVKPTAHYHRLPIVSQETSDKKYFLRLMSIDDNLSVVDLATKEIVSFDKTPPWQPHFTEANKENFLVLTMRLEKNDLPLNFMILDNKRIKIYQKAFLVAGEKNLTIPRQILTDQFYIAFLGKAGDFVLERHFSSS